MQQNIWDLYMSAFVYFWRCTTRVFVGTRFPGGIFCRGFEALGQEIVQIDPRSPCSETESP
jgi:hypothetical protein